MKNSASLFFALASTSALYASPSLIGSTATINYLFPNSSTVLATSVVSVSSGTEVSCPGFGGGTGVCIPFAEPATIDIGSTSIVLTEAAGSGYTASSFNGIQFTGLNFGPGYSLNGFTLTTDLPGLVPADISFTDSSIQFNAEGLGFASAPYTVRLDLATSTPEPATIGLFGLLTAGLGLWKLRSRRRTS